MLEPGSRIPVYLQLAALVREQIIAGQLRPGMAVPSEPYLSSEHGVSRQSVRMAMAVLREQGWVVTHRSRGTVVLPVAPPRVIEAGPGAVVRARLTVPGDPFFPGDEIAIEITQPSGEHETGPASRTVVQVTGPEGGS